MSKSNELRASAGYSITMNLKLDNQPGQFGKLAALLGAQNASLGDVELYSHTIDFTFRRVTALCFDEAHADKVLESIRNERGVEVLESLDDTVALHQGGKLSISPTVPAESAMELARVYTPGVGRVCKLIAEDTSLVNKYTIKKNSVAVVSDGSAVLGLGNIGPEAAMPVMEGKAILFKRFAGIDAYPICLNTQDTDEIIDTIKRISPGFGGVNLEDISAPRCFEIERRLQEELDIPIFHDDQHGTAVVVLAGLFNSLKIVEKSISDIKIVINGFGAGGVAIARLLLDAGAVNIVACDSKGIIYEGRESGMNDTKTQMAKVTNPENLKGSLADALEGADVFIGVSVPGAITVEMVKSMNNDSIVFALANPIPEIYPDEIASIARIIATGRSDYANQINNVLVFPGIFRGVLDSGASNVTDEMKLAAAKAIAESIPSEKLSETYIVPGCFDYDIARIVAKSVARCVES